MTKRVAVPYKETKLRVVGPQNYFDAYRIQRLDMPANLPNTTINELGNSQHAGITTGIPEVSATFNAFDVSHRLFAILCGEDPDSYGIGTGGGVDVSNLDFCDLILYVKDKNVNEHLKCIHAKYMRVTDFSFGYSVDGEATEEYTVMGSEKRYLANDVYVESGTLTASGVYCTFDLSYTPKQLKNSDYLLSFIVNGVWLDETSTYPPESDKFNVAGTTVTYSGASCNGQPCQAVYHLSTNQMTWADISDSTVPAAVRGKNIPIEIATEPQYRVQSVTIRGTFPNTKITEMGNISVVGYVVDPPDITGDITVLDVDNELVALLTTGDKADADGYGEFGVNEYEERTSQLDVIIKDPADNTTVLKTVRIPAMRITSDGTTSNVGDQLTQTYSFMSNDAQCIVYSGGVS